MGPASTAPRSGGGRKSVASAATGIAFLWGVVLNFPWEMAQMALYAQGTLPTGKSSLLGCLVAALMDGVGVTLIYGIGTALLRNPSWVCCPGRRGWLLTLGFGFIGAVLVERAALTLRWWHYGPRMPILPGLSVGLSPVLQFLILPPLALFLGTCRWLEGRRRDRE